MSPKSVWEALREYLRSTSTHGLRRVGWATNRAAKVIWGCLFAVAVGVYVALMGLLLKEYLTYPTRTLVRRDPAFQPFPGVTICNNNPVRVDMIGSGPSALLHF